MEQNKGLVRNPIKAIEEMTEQELEGDAARMITRPDDVNITPVRERIEMAEQKLLELNSMVSQIDPVQFQNKESREEFFENFKQIEILFSEIEMDLDFLEGSIKRDYPHYSFVIKLFYGLKELIRDNGSIVKYMAEAKQQRVAGSEAKTKLSSYLEKNKEKVDEVRRTIILSEKNENKVFLEKYGKLIQSVQKMKQDLETVEEANFYTLRDKYREYVNTNALPTVRENPLRKIIKLKLKELLGSSLTELKQIENQEWLNLQRKEYISPGSVIFRTVDKSKN